MKKAPSAFATLLATQSDVAAAVVVRNMTVQAACLLAETSPAARALYRKHCIFKKKNLNVCLVLCCQQGYVKCVREILAYKELNPNLLRASAIKEACANDQTTIAMLLLADARLCDIPVECFVDAVDRRNVQIIRTLREHPLATLWDVEVADIKAIAKKDRKLAIDLTSLVPSYAFHLLDF